MCTPTKWNRAPRGQLRHCNIHYPFVRPFEFIIRALPEPKCARRSTDLIFMLEKKCAQRSTRFTEFFSTLWKSLILVWFRIILYDIGSFWCLFDALLGVMFRCFFRYFLVDLVFFSCFWYLCCCVCCFFDVVAVLVFCFDAFLLSCLAHLAFLSCFWCCGSSRCWFLTVSLVSF